MDLRESFLALAEAAKRAPRNVPTRDLAWWSEFGALLIIHADAVASAANELERLRKG